MEARNVGLLVAAVIVFGFAEGSAQGRGDGAFEPLLADPKEPQFFATYLWTRSPRLASRLGSVGFGQTIGVVRGRDWQVAVAAGGVLEVHIGGPAPQLLHTHHPIGVPRTHRRRR